MDELIAVFEEQIRNTGNIVMDEERSKQFLRWLRALQVGMRQQDSIIKALREFHDRSAVPVPPEYD